MKKIKLQQGDLVYMPYTDLIIEVVDCKTYKRTLRVLCLQFDTLIWLHFSSNTSFVKIGNIAR